MAKNLSQLPALTATADTDLLHINTGTTNSDFSQTKANFLSNVYDHFNWQFNTNSTLTSQVDAITTFGTYHGRIASYGYQTATGVPVNTHFLVEVRIYNANNARIHLFTYSGDVEFLNEKNNGNWSGWRLLEYRTGVFTVIGDIFSSSADALKGRGIATIAVQGGLARIDFGAKITTAGTVSTNYVWGLDLNLIRNSSTYLSGLSVFSSGSWMAYHYQNYTPLIGATGYGTRLASNANYAIPGRLYDATSTSIGAWSSSYFSVGTYFEGHVYGKIVL